MQDPKVSVIVLNYNGVDCANNCFRSLKEQTYSNYDVLMVDNQSTDNSIAFVQKFFPWVKIIQNKKNLGYARANNEAAKQVDGDFILFLNMDTWAKHDLINELVSAARRNSRVGVCACRQLSYDGQVILNNGMSIDLIGYPLVPDKGEQVFYADGASFFIRKSLFLELGGFDSEYFMYAEEVDLCWRLMLYGYEVIPVPSAVIGHKSAGTFVLPDQEYRMNKKRKYLAERNSLRSLLKNYSILSLVFLLPARLTLVALQFLLFLLLSPEFAYIELDALMWNLNHLKGTFALRHLVQSKRRVSDRAVTKKMSKVVGIVRSFVIVRQDSSDLNWNS
jgi:GT2 family glycosyltransferase